MKPQAERLSMLQAGAPTNPVHEVDTGFGASFRSRVTSLFTDLWQLVLLTKHEDGQDEPEDKGRTPRPDS